MSYQVLINQLLGYFPYEPISRKLNIADLEKELRAYNINTFECKHGVRIDTLLLKESKKKRFESKIEIELEK